MNKMVSADSSEKKIVDAALSGEFEYRPFTWGENLGGFFSRNTELAGRIGGEKAQLKAMVLRSSTKCCCLVKGGYSKSIWPRILPPSGLVTPRI